MYRVWSGPYHAGCGVTSGGVECRGAWALVRPAQGECWYIGDIGGRAAWRLGVFHCCVIYIGNHGVGSQF